MPKPETDRIAREAARLIEIGRAESIGGAIRAAAQGLKLADAPLPSHLLVRRHAQGMAMQAMGEAAYRDQVRSMLRVAEELMTVIEEFVPEARTYLCGRAARGHLDAGVTINIRVHTACPMRELVEDLVQHGYEEPIFETADSRFGRLDRIRFKEEGFDIVILRCLPEQIDESTRDLFTGKRIEAKDLAAVRALLEA